MGKLDNHFSIFGDQAVHLDDRLREDDVILRYMDFEKFKLFLRDGLRLARADVFVKDDPFEGEYTEQVYAISKLVFTEKKGKKIYGSETLKKEVDRIRKHAFVSSWTMGESESVALWRLYGRNNDSVAIKTTVGLIKNEIEHALRARESESTILAKWMRKQLVKVDYIDHRKHDAAGEFLKINDGKILHYKNIGYRHEEEIRILFDSSEQGRMGIVEGIGEFSLIPIRPQEFIREILVSPFACDCFYDSVKYETRKYCPTELVGWSALKFAPGTDTLSNGVPGDSG